MKLRRSRKPAAVDRESAITDDPNLSCKDALCMTVVITSHSSVELYDPHPVQWMIRLWTCPNSLEEETANRGGFFLILEPVLKSRIDRRRMVTQPP
jgi:hypothetical protein